MRLGNKALLISALFAALGACNTALTQTTATTPQLIETDSLAAREDVQQFIGEMTEKHGFDHATLMRLFGQARIQDSVLARMSRPAEKSTPWHRYRNIFIQQKRIDAGLAFWKEHESDLARAEADTGVPASIIVGIIGVETFYGRITGNDQVLEALSTLAFDFPKRAPFFRSELEAFLIMTREENIDPLGLKGSYAGAMGMAQFMPSSYRAYAVDFNADGTRDLWNTPADAIGSVANYLGQHRWERGEPIAMPVTVNGTLPAKALSKKRKARHTVGEIMNWGVQPARSVDAKRPAGLVEFEGLAGPEYWMGFNNFFVITTYNHSPMYALAVFQLAEEISRQRLN